METTLKICLNKIDDIKKFAEYVIKFESDIDIIKGSKVFDAKSIMAIIALDCSNEVYVQIISDDINEIKEFNKLMKEFEVQ